MVIFLLHCRESSGMGSHYHSGILLISIARDLDDVYHHSTNQHQPIQSISYLLGSFTGTNNLTIRSNLHKNSNKSKNDSLIIYINEIKT